MISTCPECGTQSDRVLTEFDRVFPLPKVHLIRYRGENSKCLKSKRPGQPKARTTWDVEE